MYKIYLQNFLYPLTQMAVLQKIGRYWFNTIFPKLNIALKYIWEKNTHKQTPLKSAAKQVH